ncbi:hypothetical protein QUF75_09735 [Desulfococcaceae bacterium HSG7]|nr:hypothetical protein [Desulfococcaceae bacterium HSG7]
MPSFIESVIVYTTKPLKGSFSHGNLLLLPSRLREGAHSPYPMRMQFRIESEKPYYRVSSNNGDLLSKKIIESLYLLSLFSQFHFFDFHKRPKPIKKFSKNNFKPIKRGKIDWYQDKTFDDDNLEAIIFPEYIELLLDTYSNIQGEVRLHFRKALYLFNTAINLKPIYPSISFICMVSAVETLCQIEFKSDNDLIEECGNCHSVKSSPWTCGTCSAPLWGIGKKYKLFFSKYCFGNKPTKLDNRFINKVYSIRSKIVHTGKVLTVDDFWSDEWINWDQSFLQKDLLKATRISLNNWLLNQTSANL